MILNHGLKFGAGCDKFDDVGYWLRMIIKISANDSGRLELILKL